MLIKSDDFIIRDFISTDEDPGLRIESFAIIKLRGVSTKLNIIIQYFHQTTPSSEMTEIAMVAESSKQLDLISSALKNLILSMTVK